MRNDIVEVNILVSPFKIMDDALVRQLFLYDKDVLEEIDYALIDVEMVELCDHSLLILEVSLIGVNEGISFVNHTSNVVECLDVCH